MKIRVLFLVMCFLGCMVICGSVGAGVTVGVSATNVTEEGGNIRVNVGYSATSSLVGITAQNQYLLRVRGLNAESAYVNNAFTKTAATGAAIDTAVEMQYAKPEDDIFGNLGGEEKIGVVAVTAVPGGAPATGQVGEYFDATTGSEFNVTELTDPLDPNAPGFTSAGSSNEISTGYAMESSGDGNLQSGLAGRYEAYQYQLLVEGEGEGPWGEVPCVRRVTTEWVQIENVNVQYMNAVSGRYQSAAEYYMGLE